MISIIGFLRKRPMLILAVLISVGIIIGFYSFFISVVFAALCIALLFLINYKKQSGVLIFCGLWLLASTLTTAHSMNELERVSKFEAMTVSGEFIVISEPQYNGECYTCEVEVLNSKLLEKGDKFEAVYGGSKIPFGQSFRANVRLDSFGESSIAKGYYAENIYLRANLSNIVLTNNRDFVLESVKSVRDFISNEIFANFESEESATVLALLTGDRSYISDQFYSNLKGAGVMHVMVVSGMHLSIIVAFALKLVNKLLYNRFLRGTIIFITVLCIAAVCGFTMSILRAGLTYVMFALALFFNRNASSDNCLGTAVAVILLLNPFAVFSLAFLLSVFSTFGVLCVALPIDKFLKDEKIIKSKLLAKLVSAVLISFSALLTTLPITIIKFGYVSNMSIIANLLISFATTVTIWLCLAGFILFPFREYIFAVANLLVKYINAVINWLGGFSFSTTDLPAFATVIILIVIFSIIFVMIACVNRSFVLKLKGVVNKKIKEGGGRLKWH